MSMTKDLAAHEKNYLNIKNINLKTKQETQYNKIIDGLHILIENIQSNF